MTASRWNIRLGTTAENDFADILRTTWNSFGSRQTAIYRTILLDALATLSAGPDAPGNAPRDEILAGLRSLHVARRGRHGRHFIMYRASGGDTIEIVRILHDRMDFDAHIPTYTV